MAFSLESAGWALLDDLRIGPGGIDQPPVFTSHPQNATALVGSRVTFRATAMANPAPIYEWQRLAPGSTRWMTVIDRPPYSGAGSPVLTVEPISASMSGDQFRCMAASGSNRTPSNPASLTVTTWASPPVIVTHPESLSVAEGASITLSVEAAGTPPLTYAWEKDGELLAGSTHATHTVSAARVADSGTYVAVVSNASGTARSLPATVTVLAAVNPPVITVQPQSRAVPAGVDVAFQVSALGSEPLNYQWQKNSADLPGQIFPSLTLRAVTAVDTGTYRVRVANAAGAILSEEAELTVQPGIFFTKIARRQDGQVDLVLTGEAGTTVLLEVSTNLVDWQPVTSATNVTGTVAMRDAQPSFGPRCFYRAKSLPPSSILFDNGLSSGIQRNTSNDLDQRLYDNFTLSRRATITGIFWQQQDQPPEFFTYKATRVTIYADLPEMSDPLFSKDIPATRMPNDTARVYQNQYGWFEGFDYFIEGLDIVLSPGTFWLGLNTIGEGPGRTAWADTSGTDQSLPGWRVVNRNLPGPGKIDPGNLVFQIRGH